MNRMKFLLLSFAWVCMACAGAWGRIRPRLPANGANYRLFPADRPPLVPKPQQLRWDDRAIPVQSVRILAPSPSGLPIRNR
ncbi:MAG: hypothetical protein ACLSUW_06165 [Akkermansia sp.]